ncbi:MAG TPA: tRNA lysidine(34) synthetase TilS [Polyangiales bacterium]|jgi:tRNA(Ile)-lysidine synthase|nr:tRNA lysidine(34) synthetase TilS [Polyangiales bacterium]
MSTVVSVVRRTLATRGLIPRSARVLVACSGGADSAALLAVLTQLAPELDLVLEAASVDHGLRPEAARDVALARAQADQLGVPFHPLVVQVEPGASLQAQARRARYGALCGLAQRLGAQRIAVGHTRDDQLETVLQRLLRGAGVRGLSAIDPLRADGVIRPLIDADRSAVHALAHATFTQLAQDPSNVDARFTRVRVRSEVVPALRREDSALAEHLADLADDAREHAQLVEALSAELLARARHDAESLAISALLSAPAVLRRAALRLWLREHDCPLGRAHLRDLDTLCTHRRGEVWLSARLAVRAENRVILRVCVRR